MQRIGKGGARSVYELEETFLAHAFGQGEDRTVSGGGTITFSWGDE